MDRVELKFRICFRLSEQDCYYSVDNFTQKVKERLGKRKGNIMILKQRNGEKDRYSFESLLITILLALYIWLGVIWVTLILTLIIGIVIFWILSARTHAKRHNKKLYQRIVEKSD